MIKVSEEQKEALEKAMMDYCHDLLNYFYNEDDPECLEDWTAYCNNLRNCAYAKLADYGISKYEVDWAITHTDIKNGQMDWGHNECSGIRG